MAKQLRFVNEETDRVNLFESVILSVKFDSITSTITMLIDWTECDSVSAIFEGSNNLKVKLHSNENYPKEAIGVLEISGFTYQKSKNGYVIQFDFDYNLEGYIQFECINFEFITPSEPMQMGGNDGRTIIV